MVLHLVTLTVTGCLLVTALLNYSWFSLHPIMMTTAYTLLIAQGIGIFSPHSSLTPTAPYARKTNYHAFAMWSALSAALFGFYVIYSNKSQRGAPHFTSWHGFIGGCTLLYTLIQTCAGVLVAYNQTLKIPKPGLLKLAHAASGTLLYGLASAALVLGMQSSWMSINITNDYAIKGLMIGQILIALVVVGQFGQKLQGRFGKVRASTTGDHEHKM